MASVQQQAEFLAFRDACIWLRHCYNIYARLYHADEDTETVLRESAPRFFSDLSTILQEYFFLQVRKITDPPVMKGRNNLSLQYVDQLLTALGLASPELVALSSKLISYRMLTADIANRVAAHTDAETTLAGNLIGAHAEQELDAFLANMQSYTDLAGEAFGVGPLDYKTQAGVGDVLDLIRSLKRA